MLSTTEHRKLRLKARIRQNLTAYAFLAPALIFFVLFLAWPVVALLIQSFQTGGIMSPAKYVGLENWRQTFTDPLVVKSIRNTVVYSLMAIPAVFIIAMILALSLNTVRFGQNTFKTIIYYPTLQPILLAALMFTFVLHQDFGILNIILRAITGEPVNFLGNRNLALPTIAMVEVWKGAGFWTLLFLAGIQSLPRDLYHAAELDGAGPGRRFFQLTLPLLKPTFFFSFIFATIVNLQIFDSVFVLTDGGPVNATVTTTWYIYRSLFTFNEPGYGATLSFVLVILVLALTAVQTILFRERR
ncbi:sugar ABC transporter permease [Ruegeria sp.]|uniref:carbohydrate ABC transporter permease n=1 Tax=Ruegeria sp. TaxID=1879320 RepID=UPI0023192D5A|nr:sugar ABC transporter permease [Ruegeria sp.]MDA7963626.1 sugar ABC transporter permease [Ruegeria sp.]